MGAIVGRVVRARDGAPIADAAVLITGDSPTHPDIAALTSGDGRFRLSRLPPGRYTLLVNVPGGAAGTESVDVVESGEAAVEMRV